MREFTKIGSIIIGRNVIPSDSFQAKIRTISLACCRVFRPGSRPLLDTQPDVTAQSSAEAALELVDPSQIW